MQRVMRAGRPCPVLESDEKVEVVVEEEEKPCGSAFLSPEAIVQKKLRSFLKSLEAKKK